MNIDLIKETFDELVNLLISFLIKLRKIFIALFVLIIVIGLLTLTQPGIINAWIGILGTLISTTFSVLISLFVMLYTMKTNRMNQELELIPQIIASNTSFEKLRITQDALWTNDLEKVIGSLPIDLINLGKIGIYDIQGTLTVLNYTIAEQKKTPYETKIIYEKVAIESEIWTAFRDYKFSMDIQKSYTLAPQKKSVLLPADRVTIHLPKEITLFCLLLAHDISNIRKSSFVEQTILDCEIELSFQTVKSNSIKHKFKCAIYINRTDRERETSPFSSKDYFALTGNCVISYIQ